MTLVRNPRPARDSGRVAVRFAAIDRPSSADEALLSADEIGRANAFRFERDRCSFVAARAFLRRTLSAYCEISPDRIAFRYSSAGRPELPWPGAPVFSLSHSDGFALLALGDVGPIGADLERVRDMADRDSVAKTVMHPSEWSDFAGLDEAERTQAFFRLWTRKEAALKAQGTGLLAEPALLEVGLGGGNGEPPLTILDIPCRIAAIAAPARYVAALCIPLTATILPVDYAAAR